jgi:hypothetical protein
MHSLVLVGAPAFGASSTPSFQASSNHSFDGQHGSSNRGHRKKNFRSKGGRHNPREKFDLQCVHCGKNGHEAKRHQESHGRRSKRSKIRKKTKVKHQT